MLGIDSPSEAVGVLIGVGLGIGWVADEIAGRYRAESYLNPFHPFRGYFRRWGGDGER